MARQLEPTFVLTYRCPVCNTGLWAEAMWKGRTFTSITQMIKSVRELEKDLVAEAKENCSLLREGEET